jgi:two-component system OmpR family response regulator
MAKEKPRALICDDQADIRHIMELSLMVEGFEVRMIGKLDELLDTIREFDPHVLILDIMFPGRYGDGMAMCKEIKQKNVFPNLKILLCSAIARGTKRTEDEFREMSAADDVVFKPFEPLEFRKRVKALAQQGSAGA